MTKAVKQFEFAFWGRSFTMSFFPLFETPPPFAGKLIEFYDLWHSKCDGTKIPSKDDITFETLKGWHSNIRLVDMGAKPLSPKKYHIMGEIYKQYWGSDSMLSQIIAASDENGDNVRKYKECVECFYEYHYGIAVGIVPNKTGSMRKVIWMDLPLSSDSENITHLLSALIPLRSDT